MKNKISRRSFLAAAAVSAAALAVTGCDAKTSKKAVTDITVWNYYNGDQLESFNRLVSTFNETIGKAKGIRVSGSSQGTVNDLEANVMDAAEGKVGSAEMPTIFAAYADTAYKLDQMGMVVDLKDYLTEDEMKSMELIVSAYLDLAENRARRHIPMTMEDWAKRLDIYLQADDLEVLKDAGKISAQLAKLHAETEFEKYRVVQDRLYQSDFDRYLEESEI